MDWKKLNPNMRLSILAGESTVDSSLLREDETRMAMIKRGESKENCLKYINDNY